MTSAEVVQRVLTIVDVLEKPSDLTRSLSERTLRIQLPAPDAANSFAAPTAERWNYYVRGNFEGPVRSLEVLVSGPPGGGPHTQCTVDLRDVLPRLRARGYALRYRQAQHGQMHEGRVQATREGLTVDIEYYRTYGRMPSEIECLRTIDLGTRESVAWRLDADDLQRRLLALVSIMDRHDAMDRTTVETVLGMRFEREPDVIQPVRRGITHQGWHVTVFYDPSDVYGGVSTTVFMAPRADPHVEGRDQCTLAMKSFRQGLADLGFEGQRQGLPAKTTVLRFHDERRRGVGVILEDYAPDAEGDRDTTCLTRFQLDTWDPDKQE